MPAWPVEIATPSVRAVVDKICSDCGGRCTFVHRTGEMRCRLGRGEMECPVKREMYAPARAAQAEEDARVAAYQAQKTREREMERDWGKGSLVAALVLFGLIAVALLLSCDGFAWHADCPPD